MTSSVAKTRIAVVASHTLFAECLCLALDLRGHEAMQVPVPAGSSGATILLDSILAKRPNVVILDIDLGANWDWTSLIQSLARSGAIVVAVTKSSDSSRWGEALAHGARLVLPKDGPLSALTSAVRRLNDRAPLMTFEQRQTLLQAYRHEQSERHEQRARLDKLTQREGEILSHLMAGQTVSDIVRVCWVSEATVRTQIKAILAKLEVSSQIAAVAVARHSEWLPRDVLLHAEDRVTIRKAAMAAAG